MQEYSCKKIFFNESYKLMDANLLYFSLACIFGFMMAYAIGANDVANAMGTSVGSKSLTLKQALLIAAVFEFLGALLAGGEVTNTLRQDIIHPSLFEDSKYVFLNGMLSCLLACSMWLIIASFFGWPVSTTHTIVGAIIGFGLVSVEITDINWLTLGKIFLSWIISPLMGGVIAFILFLSLQKLIFASKKPFKKAKYTIPFYVFITVFSIVYIAGSSLIKYFHADVSLMLEMTVGTIISAVIAIMSFYHLKKFKFNQDDLSVQYQKTEQVFKFLIIFTGCAMAFAHGSNDVANAIGPVAAIVTKIDGTYNQSDFPVWIIFLGGAGIVVGLTTYGYKVMATIGEGITQLTPSRAFCATLATALTVLFASLLGIPISTTHTLVGGIVGIGMARGMEALNLNVLKGIVSSWVVTLPIGGVLCIINFYIISAIFNNFILV